ncbi:MAG TPA: hypothetical protein VLM79_23450 [Kofleriaceae bacterium]|nr:hypothetical protein [Kofleriaceae bacterium]
MSARAQANQQSTAATNGAELVASGAEQQVAHLAARRAELKQRYEDEVAEIDRLKKQRASWRRDRDLRDSLSASLETSKQLDAATREVDVAQRTLVNARRAFLTAIDAELKAGAPAPRAQRLGRAKVLLASQLRDVPHRILIPDLRIDPLADPEELLQHANELRASELELGRQIDELATQAIDLEHTAQLRKQHERQGDLVNRYDDQPHRNSSRAESSTDGPGVGGVSDPSSLPNAPTNVPSSFESYVPTVLADVIDASTINNFTAAQLSGDPAQRAAAARKAHDAVAQRLEQVRRKRLEIEARAKRLAQKP